MRFVEASLRRLQNNVSGFLAPSTPLRDVNALKAQIELRRRALRDIELIRGRLGTHLRCEKKPPGRRLRSRAIGRPPSRGSTSCGRIRKISSQVPSNL